VDELRRIDSACDRFEEAWRKGQRPQVEDFLLEFDASERPRLLEAVQKLQQELILKQMEQRPAAVPQVAAAKSMPVSPSTGTLTRAAQEKQAGLSDQTIGWSPKVLMRVISGPHEGEQFAYEEHNTLLVGRSPVAQLRLKDDPHFSRHHFRLEINPPTCFLMDLRSRNGTFVNGERITERFLKDGDTISGGRTKMVVSIAKSPTTIPTANVPPGNASTAETAAFLKHSSPSPRIQSGAGPIRVPGYEVHEQIGAGDLGIVHRATQIASSEVCALKVMTATAATDERLVQTFLREASILIQLQHPHIVRMIEVGALGTDLYLCTEYVDAIPWRTLVSRASVSQRIQMACELVSQILSGLEYAHARFMVHRDVKPSNILLSRNGRNLNAKLADFGLAKQYTNAGMSQVTREGDVIGSLPYMAPEQFINSRDAKPSCDIYSLAATFYWMLTEHEPILLDNHPCKFLAILEDAPTPIQQHCPEIPPALARAIHRALEKRPEKRFQSASEMRLQIRAFIK